jgi:hypothetical protein
MESLTRHLQLCCVKNVGYKHEFVVRKRTGLQRTQSATKENGLRCVVMMILKYEHFKIGVVRLFWGTQPLEALFSIQI